MTVHDDDWPAGEKTEPEPVVPRPLPGGSGARFLVSMPWGLCDPDETEVFAAEPVSAMPSGSGVWAPPEATVRFQSDPALAVARSDPRLFEDVTEPIGRARHESATEPEGTAVG